MVTFNSATNVKNHIFAKILFFKEIDIIYRYII